MTSRLFYFAGGNTGRWRVTSMRTIVGEGLPNVAFLDSSANLAPSAAATWVLRGITSNERYVTRDEKQELVAKQEGLVAPLRPVAR